ncbi:hypothetical protein BAVI_00230 [Neobacillus vireti LMG 21834]|uniref:Uncharacterized protein n=1 Tax=Neobacillus vireti LMG 21834 TaxID=1131730 RepID=A0AB94IV02_9BACI|nr:hypothetical protein BAVI_00230 [Neobacillus vireti LMG 21834]KLT17678.1 hypothetical protein AA980_11205 [Neobacillus vireti]
MQQASTSLIGAPGPLQPGPHHLYPGKIQNPRLLLRKCYTSQKLTLLIKYECPKILEWLYPNGEFILQKIIHHWGLGAVLWLRIPPN